MLLEFRSSPFSETNQNYAQKTVQNMELAQETMIVLQPPKRSSKLCEIGIKVDTSRFSRVSQNEEKLGLMPQVSQSFLSNFGNAYVPT